jgi:hypothetical protein
MGIEEKLNTLITKVDKLSEMIARKARADRYAGAELMDDYEVQMFLNISKRTLVNWRQKNIISYTQIGDKLYYQKSDIEELLKRNHIKANEKQRV